MYTGDDLTEKIKENKTLIVNALSSSGGKYLSINLKLIARNFMVKDLFYKLAKICQHNQASEALRFLSCLAKILHII